MWDRVCPKAEDRVAWRGVIDQVEVVRVGRCCHVPTDRQKSGERGEETHRCKECWEMELVTVVDLRW